jgi:hypothetical protein
MASHTNYQSHSKFTGRGLYRRLLPPLMRHAHNGHQHEPLRSDTGVLQVSYFACAISGWFLISIQQISFMNQDVSTSSSAMHWI